MNLHAHTSQKQLFALVEKKRKRDLLRALPFNLQGLRTIILFWLFPGMFLAGFKWGLILTGLVAGSLIGCMLFDQQPLALEISRVYLIFGGIVALRVSFGVFINEYRLQQKRRNCLKPYEGKVEKAARLNPQREVMDLHRMTAEHDVARRRYHAQLNVKIGQSGAYAFIFALRDYAWASPVMVNGEPAHFFQWSQGEKPEQAIAIVLLEAGVHRFELPLGKLPKGEHYPHVELTQITQFGG